MASYQARSRDPLLDRKMQAAIERRGKELLGIALIALGLCVALVLGTYVPDDPSWLSATDEPARNFFGRFGASLASPLFVIVGLGGWGIALALLVWGGRFLFHIGEERALGRVIFAPIAVALGAVLASTHVPFEGWSHSFGLGGLFGDTILGAFLGVIPVSASLGLKSLSVLVAAITVVTALFVLGFSMAELRRIGRFMLVGVILAYDHTVRLASQGAMRAAQGAQGLQDRHAAGREARAAARAASNADRDARQPDPSLSRTARVTRARTEPEVEPDLLDDEDFDDPAPRRGLLSGVTSLIRRTPDPVPELVSPQVAPDLEVAAPDDDRIREKIASVIKSRVRAAPILTARSEPPVVAAARRHPRGPQPLIADRGPRVGVAETGTTAAALAASIAGAGVGSAAGAAGAGIGAASAVASGAMNAFDAAPAHGDASDPFGDDPFAGDPYAAAYEEGLDQYGHDDPYEGYDPLTDDEDDHDALSQQSAPGGAPRPIFQPVVSRTAPEGAPVPGIPAYEPRKVVQHSPRKPAQPSRQARQEAQPDLRFEDAPLPEYESPPLSLLTNPAEIQRHHLSDEALEENARMLENVLDDYGVKGEIVSVRPGPVVTMYELEPAPGLKASRVIGLADDIARSMSALSARVSTVPGRSVIGIELPNEHREKVVLREILSHRDFGDGNQRLPLALGKDIGGDPIVANLAKMPHLLIAGTTGSGKSVAINTMILSLLYKLSPDECRLIMIDPKMLELSVYDGIPHLLSPVVTDPKKAVVALKWVVGEMEERYRKMSKMGVRNIEGYNGRVRDALEKGEMFKRTVQTGFDDETGEPVFETDEFKPETIPYIVVIVDEMADLMMVAGKEIEACIQRLAQMARASGIHLIMATQRPSVDVITGTIKANFPTRISFQVTSKIDSRTILGEQGAEQLLGMGDMLFMAGGAKITRVHGPFCSDEEVEEIVNHLKSYGPPDYVGGVVEGPDEEKGSDIDAVLGLGGNTDSEDALYDQAVAIVIKDRKCSTSYIQRKLAIGYNKAARLVEQMEEEGLVSPANHVGKREILVPEQS